MKKHRDITPMTSWESLAGLRNLTYRLDTSNVSRMLRAHKLTPERAAFILTHDSGEALDIEEALDVSIKLGVPLRVYSAFGAYVAICKPEGEVVFSVLHAREE